MNFVMMAVLEVALEEYFSREVQYWAKREPVYADVDDNNHVEVALEEQQEVVVVLI